MVNPTEKLSICDHEELVFQILMNLPVKSLTRFKCVSLNWLRLIEDPFFVKCHGAHSRTRRLGGIQLLTGHTVWPYNLVSRLYFLSDPEGNSSQSGSILLPTDFPSYKKHISNAEALVCFDNRIWNPHTRESMIISPPPYHDGVDSYLLGFDVFTSKYKLVCWSCRFDHLGAGMMVANQVPTFRVLTLGENSWKQIPVIPDEFGEGFEVLSSISFSNMIFCLMRCKQIFGVMTFDVQHEHVRFIPFLPEFQSREKFHIRLAEIEGHLAIQGLSFQGIGRTVWVLNHEITQWTKMEINIPGCSNLFGDEYIMTCLILIGTVHTKEILFQCNAVEKVWKQGIRLFKYFYYDPETKKIRFVPKLDKFVDEEWDYMMIKHVDSLVTLKHLNGPVDEKKNSYLGVI